MSYRLTRTITDAETGESFVIGPDDIGLIDLSEVNHDGTLGQVISMTAEEAKLVAAALIACAGEIGG
jgi:hypothetical protein